MATAVARTRLLLLAAVLLPGLARTVLPAQAQQPAPRDERDARGGRPPGPARPGLRAACGHRFEPFGCAVCRPANFRVRWIGFATAPSMTQSTNVFDVEAGATVEQDLVER